MPLSGTQGTKLGIWLKYKPREIAYFLDIGIMLVPREGWGMVKGKGEKVRVTCFKRTQVFCIYPELFEDAAFLIHETIKIRRTSVQLTV